MNDERDPGVRDLVHELVRTAPTPPSLRFEAGAPQRGRRRAAIAAISTVAAAAVVVGLVVARDRQVTNPSKVTTPTAPLPFADLQVPVAIAGGPSVRIVSRTGVVTIRSPSTCCVQWSADGRWLAFLSNADSERASHGDLVVARADGSQERVVANGVDEGGYAWSARDHILAISDSGVVTLLALDGRFGGQGAFVAQGHGATSLAWSARGDQLAVTAPAKARTSDGSPWSDGTSRDALRIASLDDLATCHSLATCVHVGAAVPISSRTEHFQLRVAAWRPDGRAIVLWVESLDDNGRLDGAPLVLAPLDGRLPVQLGSGVVQPDWVQWSPDGSRLVFVEGVGRFVLDDGRTIAICTAAGVCHAVTAQSLQARDPAWSPDGRSLVYTRIGLAEEVQLANRTPGDWRPVFAHRELWTTAGGGAPIRLGPLGIGAPQYVGDGDHVLLVQDRKVEQLDLRTGAVLIVGALVEPPNFDAAWHEPHFMPDDHPYEGIESGPGGWSRWFAPALRP